MSRIAIVTHCFAELIPHYAAHLKFQLAMLVNHFPPPEGVKVTVAVAYVKTDKETRKVLHYFGKNGHDRVSVVPVKVTMNQMLRRAVVRNVLAKDLGPKNDAVWFTDVDYSFGSDCLKSLSESKLHPGRMYCPTTIRINTTHEDGDKMVANAAGHPAPAVDTRTFTERRQKVIIGGCMIVAGETAAKGYLDGTKWTNELTDEEIEKDPHFRKCNCDRAYRKSDSFTRKSVYLDLPSVFRIRHSTNHVSERAKS